MSTNIQIYLTLCNKKFHNFSTMKKYITLLVLTTATNLYAQVGIGTTNPTETLDIASGNVRIRDINSSIGLGGNNRQVVADVNGVLKTIEEGAYGLFHARLAGSQSIGSNVVTTLLFSAPLSTSPLYTYNTTTGTLIFNKEGNYLITLQASFANTAANTQLILGVRPIPDANYLARGSHYNAVTTGANVGELMIYTTLLIVPNANYQVRFVAVANNNSRVIATEIGNSGSGNVTNVTIQKI